MVVGILALQGAYEQHRRMLGALGVEGRLVRTPDELDVCAALIVPGGESTTMTRLIQANGLFEPLQAYARDHSLMGTCAGLIMMAERVDDARVTPLGLLPVEVGRNRYGRQIHSFMAPVQLAFDSEGAPFEAVFIRAPAITDMSAEVEVLARHQDRPVMVRHGRHLGLTFHPELTDDLRIHRYWLEELAGG